MDCAYVTAIRIRLTLRRAVNGSGHSVLNRKTEQALQKEHRVPIIQFAAVFVAAVLTGCAQSPSRVSTDVFTCCEADFYRYATYQVTMTNVPGFLEPYLRGGIVPVLEQKGLVPTMDRPDLTVNVIFNQVFLTPDSVEQDYFGEGVDPGIASRFMAAIAVDMIDTDTDRIVWSGRLSRIHNDPHGQPRGNDHKMQGIIDGFGELFADYPIRLVDTSNEL